MVLRARTVAVALLVGCWWSACVHGRPIVTERQLQQQQQLQVSFAELKPTLRSIWVPSISTSAKTLQIPVSGLPGTPLPLESMSRLIYTVTYKRRPAYVLEGTVSISLIAAFSSSEQQQIQQPLVTLTQGSKQAAVPDANIHCSSLTVSHSNAVNCGFAVTIFALDAPPPGGTAQALVQIPGTGTHFQTPPMTYDFSSLAPLTSHMRLGAKNQMSDLLFDSLAKPPDTTALVTNYFEHGSDVILPTGVAGSQPPPKSLLTDTKTYTYTALFGDIPREKCGKKWKVLATASIESTSDGLQPPETATNQVDLDLLGCEYQAAPAPHGCETGIESAAAAAAAAAAAPAKRESDKTHAAAAAKKGSGKTQAAAAADKGSGKSQAAAAKQGSGPKAAAAAAKKGSGNTLAAHHTTYRASDHQAQTTSAKTIHHDSRSGATAAAAADGGNRYRTFYDNKQIQLQPVIIRSGSNLTKNSNVGQISAQSMKPVKFTVVNPATTTTVASVSQRQAVERKEVAVLLSSKRTVIGTDENDRLNAAAAVPKVIHHQQQQQQHVSSPLGELVRQVSAADSNPRGDPAAGVMHHASAAAAAVEAVATKGLVAEQLPGQDNGQQQHQQFQAQKHGQQHHHLREQQQKLSKHAEKTSKQKLSSVGTAAQPSEYSIRKILERPLKEDGTPAYVTTAAAPANTLMAVQGSTLCGRFVCSPGQTCMDDIVCCDPGGSACGGSCCPSGNVCMSGRCMPPGSTTCGATACSPSQMCLNGKCCNANVPACGNTCCDADQMCVNGICAASGSAACGTQVCGPDQQCVAPGICCGAGATQCGSTCCGSGNTCINGQCVAGGSSLCAGQICGPGSVCTGGAMCCPVGASFCSGSCCGAGNQCVEGRCVGYGSTPCGGNVCNVDQTCQSGVCCNRGESGCGAGCCATGAGMQCFRNQCLPAGTQPCGTTTCPPGTFCGDPYRSICCAQGTRACGGSCCPADNVCSWRQTCVPWNSVEAGTRQASPDYIANIEDQPGSEYNRYRRYSPYGHR